MEIGIPRLPPSPGCLSLHGEHGSEGLVSINRATPSVWCIPLFFNSIFFSFKTLWNAAVHQEGAIIGSRCPAQDQLAESLLREYPGPMEVLDLGAHMARFSRSNGLALAPEAALQKGHSERPGASAWAKRRVLPAPREARGSGPEAKLADFRSRFENNTPINEALFSIEEQKIGSKAPCPEAPEGDGKKANPG